MTICFIRKEAHWSVYILHVFNLIELYKEMVIKKISFTPYIFFQQIGLNKKKMITKMLL